MALIGDIGGKVAGIGYKQKIVFCFSKSTSAPKPALFSRVYPGVVFGVLCRFVKIVLIKVFCYTYLYICIGKTFPYFFDTAFNPVEYLAGGVNGGAGTWWSPVDFLNRP